MSPLNTFLMGANTLGCALASLFFLRARRRTRDPLFAAFAAAFFLLGVGQGLGAMTSYLEDEIPWVFLLRLAAFALIIVAIAGKNLRATKRG